ncbi:cobalt transporter [Aureimonas sp. SA4125]|uniref:CbtA family protein n=1 Tax=Aureimonas sp. SA4125 TaxID=2826993 RepID=UPI001CC65DE3|nr:CbtA family protein [Aureimonas sp. SA4125]BDA82581.1 cobalt transporter [Aureimonas sp. SA4125]
MIVRMFLAALAAGLFAGLLITPVQYARVIPLILHAETFEGGGAPAHDHAASLSFTTPAEAATLSPDDGATVRLVHTHATAAGDAGEGGPLVESRLLGTVLANLVTGAGFALILAAASLVLDRPITAATGALWGLIGFAVIHLAPAIGLAPELPAMPVADLGARQLWWIVTAVLAAFAAYALILRREAWMQALGIAALVLPHFVGAPHPADLASPVPPTLAAEFAVASLVTTAGFWLLLGQFSGHAFDRMRRTSLADPRPA